jgi:hypothetical protein
MKDQKDEAINKFGIEVQGIELPEEIKKRIATELQEVILRNLSSLDIAPRPEEIGPKQEDLYIKPIFKQWWYGGLIKYLGRLQDERVKDLPGQINENPTFFTRSQ